MKVKDVPQKPKEKKVKLTMTKRQAHHLMRILGSINHDKIVPLVTSTYGPANQIGIKEFTEAELHTALGEAFDVLSEHLDPDGEI